MSKAALVTKFEPAGGEDPTRKLHTLEDLLTTHYDWDAWAQPVMVPGFNGHGRTNIATAMQNDAVLTMVFLDYDTVGHRPWSSPAEEYAATSALRKSFLQAGLSPAVYGTARGVRVVWELKDPIPFAQSDDYLAQFRDYVDQKVTPPDGLELDQHATGSNRCYRLPYIVRDDHQQHTPVLVVKEHTPLVWTPPKDPKHRNLYTELEDHDVPARRELTEEEWARFPAFYRDEARAGKEILPRSGRNSGTFGPGSVLSRLSREMARYTMPDCDLIWHGIRSSLDASRAAVPGDPEPDLGRAYSTLHAFTLKDARERQENQTVKDTVIAMGNQTNAPDPEEDEEEHSEIQKPEDIRRANRMRAFNLATENAEQPWIVVDSLAPSRLTWVRYADGSYREKQRDMAPRILEREYGVSLQQDDGKRLGFHALAYAIAADAHGVSMKYWIPGRTTRFDPATQTLNLVAKHAGLHAVYHPEIDDFLRVFAGDQYERLLDWISVIFELDQPVCALFLAGEANSGKTLLGEGLSSVWGKPASYGVVSSTFHHGVERTPFIFAGEGIALSKPADVDAFKELITQRSTSVNRKNLAPVTVVGCPRVVIAGNDANALSVASALGNQHLRALEERVLLVQSQAAATGYLDDVDTHDWVFKDSEHRIPGRIAEHALWLREHHKLSKPAKRLLVYGEPDSAWRASRIIYSNSVESAILIALAQWAADDRPTIYNGMMLSSDYPGLVLVNAGELRKGWTSLLNDQRAPAARTVAQALDALSTWDESRPMRTGNGKRLRFHAIRAEAVLEAASMAGIGAHEDMVAVLYPEQKDAES